MKKLNNPYILAFLLILVIVFQILAFWYLVWGRETPALKEASSSGIACLEKERYARIDCLMPYVVARTETVSPEVALAEVMDMVEEGAIDDCHLLAHEIGRTTLAKTGNTARAFGACPLGCVEGCFHGVMQAYAEQKGPAEVFKEVSTLCAEVGSDPLLYRQCLHGVGHGLFAYATGSIKEALVLCSNMPDSFAQGVCEGGAYMENINQYMMLQPHELRVVLPTLCDDLNDPSVCAYAVGEGLMFYTGHRLDDARALCTTLPVSLYDSCEKGAQEEQALAERTKNGQ